jgi:hypothetical protein
VIGPKSRRIDVIDTPAHAVFPERHMGFEAFPVPVIGKPEIEDGLGSCLGHTPTLAGDDAAHQKKEGLNRSSGQVQQGGNEDVLNEQPQVAL